ncbi:hypothetical protein NLJ89_g11086 [Agrocybe chaxingu]|uniref:Uncharacterized protein n=1 Tax=Agrocybe chaxingu TaxID=84603 RepID=A0A9W8JPX7_9AGAR|nr:hypothetical protein NLJ89_g11086 [Agrocybe chaxingu]
MTDTPKDDAGPPTKAAKKTKNVGAAKLGHDKAAAKSKPPPAARTPNATDAEASTSNAPTRPRPATRSGETGKTPEELAAEKEKVRS